MGSVQELQLTLAARTSYFYTVVTNHHPSHQTDIRSFENEADNFIADSGFCR